LWIVVEILASIHRRTWHGYSHGTHLQQGAIDGYGIAMGLSMLENVALKREGWICLWGFAYLGEEFAIARQ